MKGKVKNKGVGIEKLGFYYKKKEQTGNIEPSDQDSIITYEGATWQLSILSPARLRIWSRRLGIMFVLFAKNSLASLLLM